MSKRKASEISTSSPTKSKPEYDPVKKTKTSQSDDNADWYDGLISGGWLPDFVVRMGIRAFLKERLYTLQEGGPDLVKVRKDKFIQEMTEGPIAESTDEANEQHYMVTPDFFLCHLGPRLKYSCCYYPRDVGLAATYGLGAAEKAMFQLYVERGDFHDGQNLLELGCGWGSATLFMAETFPNSTVTAVSNSSNQRKFIEARAKERGLNNVHIITDDVNDFKPPAKSGKFDRVYSIEMFEHMRNWGALLTRIHGWLKTGGKVFLHHFSHVTTPYHFEEKGVKNNWMARKFFTGGIMPSHDMAAVIADTVLPNKLKPVGNWKVNGRHYGQTCEDWLIKLDHQKDRIRKFFQASGMDAAEAEGKINEWRTFYLACAELFWYNHGNEWIVSHHTLERVD